jgi:hypothetical protein
MANYKIYDLVSCDNSSYPDITDLTSGVINHAYEGLIVYIDQTPPNVTDPSQTYKLTLKGTNTSVLNGWLPKLITTNLDTCADAIADKMYILENCADATDTRNVLLASAYTNGTVLRFTGECTCWKVIASTSVYDENPTVSNSFSDCSSCLEEVLNEVCEYEERQVSYAVALNFPDDEPADRGFSECCVSALVLADLSDDASYKNDYTTVFYKRQTPNDTVTYKLVGVSTGITTLVDPTHGTLYAYGGTEQPDLSYFRVEWRDVLSTLGEDIYTIRMELSIAGVAVTIDSPVSYDLRQFSQKIADNTARIDWNLDGKLVKIDTDFKNTNYSNSVRLQGFFGDRQAKIEQDNVTYSSKKGYSYFQDQITMSNNYEYIFNAYNVPECMVRPLYQEGIFANEFFISDYNLNNHSYFYELLPVILVDDNGAEYQVRGRGMNVNLTFADRTKDNRKTNC